MIFDIKIIFNYLICLISSIQYFEKNVLFSGLDLKIYEYSVTFNIYIEDNITNILCSAFAEYRSRTTLGG